VKKLSVISQEIYAGNVVDELVVVKPFTFMGLR
jgi:hypothetical protein